MKKLIRVIQFIIFLRRNNAYGKFRRNYERSRNPDNFWKYIIEMDLLTYNPDDSVFSGAFVWRGSPEGNDYWRVLNGVWCSKFKPN